MKANLGKIAIVGVGLIGGSLALALKRAGLVAEVWGLDRDLAALHEAQQLGVIDHIGTWEQLQQADIIVLATPVAALFGVCAALRACTLKETVVVTDVGSTKQSVLQAMTQAFGSIPPWFVPGHPIAGREQSGVAAATPDLFVRHKTIVTPLAETSAAALGVVTRMWLGVGAMVTLLPVAEHDAILGATSHLPHVLAFLLVDMLNKDLNHEEIFSYAAGGFRDFTRIASSNPVMWRDICTQNAAVLQKLIANFRARLVAFEQLLGDGDGARIESLFLAAKMARDKHYQRLSEEHL